LRCFFIVLNLAKSIIRMPSFLLHEKVLTADLDGVLKLISENVELNELDNFGQSSLHWAVFGGYYEIVEALLKAGANPNIISDDKVSARWRAKDFGLIEIEKIIAEYGGVIIDGN
jgi:FOG: Ankyrin repeat